MNRISVSSASVPPPTAPETLARAADGVLPSNVQFASVSVPSTVSLKTTLV